jgi:hypothetical protein
MNIILDYLQESDYEHPSYKSATNQLEKMKVIKCEAKEDFKQTILGFGQFNEDITLTILSHGHEKGIAKGTWDSLISWDEIIELINGCKGNYDLKLNLLSICNSKCILSSSSFYKQRIDEVWLTNSNVVSINKALYALSASSFYEFKNQLEENEKELYEIATIRKEDPDIGLEDEATKESISKAKRLAKELGKEGDLPEWMK